MRSRAFTGCAIVLLFSAAAAVHGSGKAEASPVSWDTSSYAVVRTGDFDQIFLGDFFIWNDAWGRGSLSGARNLIFKAAEGSNVPFGWKWEWPSARTDDVKTYQSLSYGWHPWVDRRTNDVLPARIGDIAGLRVDYEAVVNASGKYNLAFDMWITESSWNTDPGELNVKREFMIWMDRRTAIMDNYFLVGTVSIGGEDYLFYRIEALKGTLSSRDFMVFIKKTPMHAGTIDLADFLSFMLDRKYLAEDEYLKNIDFGNEVWYGQGETTVSRFDVTLTTR